MSETLATFRTRVQGLSRVPTTVVDDPETDKQIGKAIKVYDRKRPLVVTTAFTASTSSNLYTLTDIVAGWSERYAVKDVLYRTSSGKRDPVDGNAWEVQETDGTYALYLQPMIDIDEEYLSSFPTSYFLQYSGPHTLTADTSTIRDEDLEALASLAASYCCKVAANEASDEKDSTYVSDVVDYQNIAEKWHKAARELKRDWDDHIKGRTGGHSSFGEWDLKSSRGRMVWHGSRRF